MLKENLKTLRKQKGLSQEELSIKLNVVRQTISKWEQGLSVPDSEMLISISEVFEIPVSTLLGETISETKDDDLKVISEKLEIINYQLSQQQKLKRKKTQCLLIALSIIIIITFVILFLLDSPYLNWDYSEPENAVLGVTFHTFEWIFVRIALIVFISSIVGIVIIQKKK